MSQDLNITLHAQNLTTGDSIIGKIIPESFFADLKDELDLHVLFINGVQIRIANSGYAEINKFIQTLKEYDNQPLNVVAAVINTHGLLSKLTDVFSFCDNKIIETLINSDKLFYLKDIVADQWSNDQLEAILENIPADQKEVVTNYFNHEQFKTDLFINELGYIKNDEVEIVYKKRPL